MIVLEQDGYWIVLDETIAAHHEDVFAAITTSSGLSSWYSLDAEVDLRQGGTIVFCWDQDCERKTTIAILDYDAGGMIVWDWYADATDYHAPIYWKVEPRREQGSKIIVRQGPFKRDEDALVAMAEEAEARRWCLFNMRSVFESKHDMRKHRPL